MRRVMVMYCVWCSVVWCGVVWCGVDLGGDHGVMDGMNTNKTDSNSNGNTKH